ncbi:acyl-CoA dehydrogenase [Paenibacillus frigoriresistens]|uniref:acyl-CoA dehydrogenase n=1 Tax=Paenibacillus alginolyticus TaxID=59839 RepID=UPI00156416DC|nr:acyl-CoA dehydrogenase [Paenibacillus frigoriresistens]NRF91320.1 acyl-CoA dehydrogenase [Paenibacillus frigoriresistens]
MHVSYTDEQNMIRSMVREFAINEVEPTAAQRDEEERFDRVLFDKMGKLGLTGIPWPKAYGGLQSDFLTYAMVIEELSRVCGSTGVMLSVHTSLVSWAIYKYGTEEQKQKFLLPLAEGKKLGAYSLTESGSGSDAGAMRTTAIKDGDSYVLNGSKLFVTNGGEAEVYIVFAMTDVLQRQKGCSAFIVAKGTSGFIFGSKEKKLGIRSSPTLELRFENCRVPMENLLGPEGEGFRIAMKSLDGGRIGIAAQALGIAQGALDASIAYAKERKKPIGGQQTMAFQIADMATQIEAARLLTYQAAWRESKGLTYGKQAAIAKLFASDTAVKACIETVQIFGGDGYTKDFPVERFLRDAKVTQIYEGTNEIQRIVISRMLLAD